MKKSPSEMEVTEILNTIKTGTSEQTNVIGADNNETSDLESQNANDQNIVTDLEHTDNIRNATAQEDIPDPSEIINKEQETPSDSSSKNKKRRKCSIWKLNKGVCAIVNNGTQEKASVQICIYYDESKSAEIKLCRKHFYDFFKALQTIYKDENCNKFIIDENDEPIFFIERIKSNDICKLCCKDNNEYLISISLYETQISFCEECLGGLIRHMENFIIYYSSASTIIDLIQYFKSNNIYISNLHTFKKISSIINISIKSTRDLAKLELSDEILNLQDSIKALRQELSEKSRYIKEQKYKINDLEDQVAKSGVNRQMINSLQAELNEVYLELYNANSQLNKYANNPLSILSGKIGKIKEGTLEVANKIYLRITK